MRNFKYLLRLWRKKKRGQTKVKIAKDVNLFNPEQSLSNDLNVNLQIIREKLGSSMDLVFREFSIGNNKAALVCIDGLIDKQRVDSHILQPLHIYSRMAEPTLVKGTNTLTALDYQELFLLNEMFDKIFSEYTALLIDGLATALAIETVGYESRDVSEPETETVVRGPREGFTERLQVNMALLSVLLTLRILPTVKWWRRLKNALSRLK